MVRPPIVAPDPDGIALDGRSAVVDVTANDQPGEGSIDRSTVRLIAPGTGGQLATSVTVPGQGTWTVSTTGDTVGNVTFTPEAQFSGPAVMQYVVSNTLGAQSQPAWITVRAQHSPVAQCIKVVRPANQNTGVNVIDQGFVTDVDQVPDGPPELDQNSISFVLSDGTWTQGYVFKDGGAWVFNRTNHRIYFNVPNSYVGSSTINYALKDVDGNRSNVASLTVTIDPNQPTPVLTRCDAPPPTNTATTSPTSTQSPTSTDTATSSPTSSATETATSSPTSTATSTAPETSTSTDTNSPTSTSTQSTTSTATSSTSSSTATATGTATLASGTVSTPSATTTSDYATPAPWAYRSTAPNESPTATESTTESPTATDTTTDSPTATDTTTESPTTTTATDSTETLSSTETTTSTENPAGAQADTTGPDLTAGLVAGGAVFIVALPLTAPIAPQVLPTLLPLLGRRHRRSPRHRD